MNEINIDEYRSDQTIFNDIKGAIDVTRDYIEKIKPDVETKISQITDKTRSFNSNFDIQRYEVSDNDVQPDMIVQNLAQMMNIYNIEEKN